MYKSLSGAIITNIYIEWTLKTYYLHFMRVIFLACRPYYLAYLCIIYGPIAKYK
jgi:hypothetical protein